MSGDSYEGMLADDKFAGRGVFRFASGNVFAGDFEDNKRVVGTYTLANGDVYEGAWKNDKFSGRGTYTLKSGAAYAGLWRKGKIHVKGGEGATVTLADGTTLADPAAIVEAWQGLCPRRCPGQAAPGADAAAPASSSS